MSTAVAHRSQTSARPAPETPLSSSPSLCAEDGECLGYPSGQAGSLIPAVATPGPWSLPCSLLKAEKSLTRCKHCSAPTQTSVWCQHDSLPKSKTFTGAATQRKINSIPAKSSTGLQFRHLPRDWLCCSWGLGYMVRDTQITQRLWLFKKGCSHS